MTHPDVRYWSIDRQRVESGAKTGEEGDGTGPVARQVLTIDSVRKVIGWTAFRPTELARTFIIIDDVETMVDAAQQAMLKMLEDAADYVTVILLVTSSAQVLDTVRSRCMDVSLQLVPTRTIVDGVPGPDAESIAAFAAGRPGWAIQARNDGPWLELEIARLDELESWLLKPASQRLIEAYKRGTEFARKRPETYVALERAQLIWRDCALVATGMGEYAFDQQRAERIASRVDANLAGWHLALTATRACVQDLNGNIRPRLAMQHMVNQWPTLS